MHYLYLITGSKKMENTINKKSPLVYIIVINYINYQDTIECIESLKKLNYSNFQIIIIDNASPNNSADVLKEKYKKNHIILQCKKNLKYSGGNNYAVDYIFKKLKKPDYILILNNDTKIIDKQMLTILVKYAEAIKDLGVISPKIIKPNGKEDGPYTKPTIFNCIFNEVFFPFAWFTRLMSKFFRRLFKLDYLNHGESVYPVYRVSGSCMLVKFTPFMKVGKFDYNGNLYGEETILAEKFKSIGYKNYYCSYTQILHSHSQSISLIYTEKEKYYRMLKSNLYFFSKYRGYNKFNLTLVKLSSIIFVNIYLPIICLLKGIRYNK